MFTDQLNREVEIKLNPQKIISLVPSQTEFLADLGLSEQLAGITKFCIHPQNIYKTTKCIGGTKKIDFDKIIEINPDLIIGNKEENDKTQIEKLMQFFPVWISDIKNIDQAYDMMIRLGEVTERFERANEIVKVIKTGFDQLQLKRTLKPARPSTAVYLIWQNPYMTINSDTFIHDIIVKAGFENLYQHSINRYPKITVSEMKELNPNFIFLSSEPYPFNETHRHTLSLQFPGSKVMLVNGELFSWYGSRLKYTPAYLQDLLEY